MSILSRLKESLAGPNYEELEKEQGYLELDTELAADESRKKVLIRPFQLEEFEDVKPVLNALREGRTVALINIRPLKERDLIELKRAIAKIKKTVDAISGELAGFGEDYIVACPGFATIHRSKATQEVKAETADGQQVPV